jgi:hypothetical protein
MIPSDIEIVIAEEKIQECEEFIKNQERIFKEELGNQMEFIKEKHAKIKVLSEGLKIKQREAKKRELEEKEMKRFESKRLSSSKNGRKMIPPLDHSQKRALSATKNEEKSQNNISVMKSTIKNKKQLPSVIASLKKQLSSNYSFNSNMVNNSVVINTSAMQGDSSEL